jgi:hypothetical protein
MKTRKMLIGPRHSGLVAWCLMLSRLLSLFVRTAHCWLGALLLFAVTPSQAATTTALPDGTVGVAYNQTFSVPAPDSNGICWSEDFSYANWDSNLVFSPVLTDTTGCVMSITGTPATVGTSTVTIDVYNQGNTAIVATYNYTVTVNAIVPTTVALAASSNSVTYGSSVTLTANLAGTAAASGTVTFKDGSTILGTTTVSGYTASFSTSSLAIGSHSITAVFNGDSTSSSAITVTVTQVAPTLSMSASAGTATYGSAVTLNAVLSGGISASGTVTFKDGANTLGSGTLASNAATFSTSSLAVGVHTLTAVYGGDTSNASATSASITVTISKAVTSTTVSASSSALVYGASVTLTAVVSDGVSASGTITFMDGATTLGTGTLSGNTATLTTSSLAVGSHAVTATYAGDGNNQGSVSSSVSVTVTQVSAAVTLAASATNISFGTSITLTATISGNSPGGTVTFKDGTTSLGSATVSAGVASMSLTSLSVGSHSITVQYGGDTNNASATSSATTVTVSRVTASISLTTSAAAINEKASVTFTATLTGGYSPTGTITFADGGTSLGSVTVSGGVASLTTSALTAGSHTITAAYSGDTNNSALTSGSVAVAVASISPAVASLSPSGGTAQGGTSITISGSNLSGATSVTFGGSAAKISANTASTITVVSPLHAPGAVDIVIAVAMGTITLKSGFTYAALSDPTRSAAVAALVTAQAQAVHQFSSAHLSNFNQRMESLHADGWAPSSFGLGFSPTNSVSREETTWGKTGDVVNDSNSEIAYLRRGLRKTGLSNSAETPQSAGNDDHLPDLPQSSQVRNKQDMSWWIGGALDIGQQKSSASQSGSRLTTSGISFGGDYRLSRELTFGLGGGYSRSHYQADDASSRSTGQAVMAVAYASIRPISNMYVDAMAGYGTLHFDLSRIVSDTGLSASGSRGGHQAFGSLTVGYEWRGESWLLSPYGRVDIARANLDRYAETSSGTGALTYFRQTIRDDAAYLGLRSELNIPSTFGMFTPQARIAYQHSLQGAGQAAITYSDPLLASPVYTYADTAQDSKQWLLTLGGRVLLKSGVSFLLLYTHNAANATTTSQSVKLTASGKF